MLDSFGILNMSVIGNILKHRDSHCREAWGVPMTQTNLGFFASEV